MSEKPTQLSIDFINPGTKTWGEVTTKGVTFKPATTREEWLEVMKQFVAYYEVTEVNHVRARFLLGDALAFGESAFGEEFSQAIDQTRTVMQISAKTVENSAWVARSIPPENRRDELTFSHHEVVAKLEPSEQAAMLDRAEDDGLTVAALKKAVKESHPKPPKPKAEKPPTLEDALAACEKLLIFFAPLLQPKGKPDINTASRFFVQMADIAKIAAKITK